MPIIYIEGIETTLLTLFGCILGFIGGKVVRLTTPVLWLLPLNSQTFEFSFQLFLIFTFVRSRFDLEEKIARTDPDSGQVPTTVFHL